MQPRFIIRQQLTALVNKYTISTANQNGEVDDALWYVQQKRLSMKEKVTFYSDEAHSVLAFTFRAEKVMDVHGRYFVEDASGTGLGMFRKDFKASFAKSTWHIVDGDDTPRYTLCESNATLALIRRYAGYIPFVGSIAEIISSFMKYHFDVIDVQTQETIGKYTKLTLFRDSYMLELDDAAYQAIDNRVWAALAVALDALQSR